MNIPPKFFDRNAIAKNLERRTNTEIDFITQLILNDLTDRLATLSRSFSKALILAPFVQFLPKEITTPSGVISFEHISTLNQADAENVPSADSLPTLGGDYDLIVSLYDLAIVDNVPAMLAQLHNALQPDGLLIAAFVGGLSLTELRAAWLQADAQHLDGAAARVAPFIDTSDAAALLQRAGLALPVADVETHTIRYADPLALMREIKNLGASNPLIGKVTRPVTKAHLQSANQAYLQSATDSDGRCRATLEIVWLSGWSPHDSQQKPLKRGSAEISLTKVLGKSGSK